MISGVAAGIEQSSTLAGATGAVTCNSEVLLAHADGSVTVEGVPQTGCAAAFDGSMAGKHLNAPVVAVASTPDGKGYWLLGSDGGIFTFGDAQFYGSTGSMHLNAPIVAMASTPDGKGYWLVGSDGGIFSFGDAQFYGSTGSLKLNKPIVGMATDAATGGYWLVASDGGVFAFHAPFFGSMGGKSLNAPIHFVTGTPDDGGYRLVGSDGGVFDFGDAQYYGSAASTGSSGWDALAVTADGAGYWLIGTAGGTLTEDHFGDAQSGLTQVAGDSSAASVVGAATLAETPTAPTAPATSVPAITTQPTSVVVAPASAAFFTAAATGTPTPTVQWEVSNGNGGPYIPIPGATSPTFSFTTSSAWNGYDYEAVFTNSAGSVTSEPAVLAVGTGSYSSGGEFADASCAPSGGCVAVGSSTTGVGLIEHATSVAGPFVSIPLPANTGDLGGVDCVTGASCVAVGNDTVLYSTDGGYAWKAGTMPPPTSAEVSAGSTEIYELGSVSCENASDCAATGVEDISAPGYPAFQSPAYVYTTDGGATWIKSGTGSGDAAAVVCGPSSCLAVGEVALYSNNGGASWTQNLTPENEPIRAACTTDDSTCLAVGGPDGGPSNDGALDASSDQGHSWTSTTTDLPTTVSSTSLDSIACGGTTSCVAAGLDVVLSTSTSGTEWTVGTLPAGLTEPPGMGATFPASPGLACAPNGTCLMLAATSSGAAIWESTNNGSTWTQESVQ